MTITQRLSRVIGPVLPGDIKGMLKEQNISKSQNLFGALGLISFTDGMGTLLPFLKRSLRKLEVIVRKEMDEVSALEIALPTLTQARLFEKSGRSELTDLYRLQTEGDKGYVLSPTHEEAVTNLLASFKFLNHSQLPCRLYQISNKFRNEKRAKCGLLRSKEFVMKDLYCFDSSVESSADCYKEVVNRYHHFFQLLGVPYLSVKGSPGDIGGLNSDEFHFLSDAGEDRIVLCKDCGHNENSSTGDGNIEDVCQKCNSKNIEIRKGIEVGHTFNLGTRYTKPLNATFLNKNGKPEFLHMCCFGLGLTRILAASVEVLCTPEEIRWPLALVPYLICIIPPKDGSKEEKSFSNGAELIYRNLNECFQNEVVLDDRTSLTIGKRLVSVKKLGFPFVVVAGKQVCNSPVLVEVHDVNAETMDLVQVSDISQFILNKLSRNADDIAMLRSI